MDLRLTSDTNCLVSQVDESVSMSSPSSPSMSAVAHATEGRSSSTPRRLTTRRPLPVTDLVMKSMGFQPMTREREQELARAWRQTRDGTARAALIEAHLRLVTSIARGLINRGIPLDELVAEGNIGLIRAVDRFDPDASARLSTFAFGHIRHAMNSLFRRNSAKGRLGHQTRRDVALLETSSARLHAQFGREPTEQELAEAMGWTLSQVAKARRSREQVSEWAQRLSHEMRQAASNMSTTSQVLEIAERRIVTSELVRRALETLSPLERRVIELTFGIGAKTSLATPQIAALMGLPTRDVSRIKSVAQIKLTRHQSSLHRAS